MDPVESNENLPSPEKKGEENYLECVDPNCEYYGLIKLHPLVKQTPWSLESARLLGKEKLATVECPGCTSARVVHSAEELAPDIKDPKALDAWIQKYVSRPLPDFAHKPQDVALAKTKEQLRYEIKDQINDGLPEKNIKQSLVSYASRDYPAEQST